MPKHIKNETDGTAAGAHAKGFSYKGDTDDVYPDALESLEPSASPSLFGDDMPLAVDEPVRQADHATNETEEIPPYLRKSRRLRRILIVVVILLVALLAAGAYFAVQLFDTAQTAASQQTQLQADTQDTASIDTEDTKDATTQTTKTTTAPSLTGLLGLTQDAALAELAESGPEILSSSAVNEDGNPIKTDLRIALTDEPSDSRTGTPTVYLGLAEDGTVIQAGYSASTTSLGYGSLSFSDAVENESIIEKTLQEAGIQVQTGTVELPVDKTEYSSYASDGTTLVKEYCPFSGTVDINGVAHEWSAVLSYDYSVANASGNLADTIRIIYVYINA